MSAASRAACAAATTRPLEGELLIERAGDKKTESMSHKNVTPELPPRPEMVQQIFEDHITLLAALDGVAYDQKRQAAADALSIRVTTLDTEVAKRRPHTANGEKLQGTAVLFNEPEPWPAQVDGAATLSAVADTLNEYLHLPDGASDAVALWIASAHCFQSFQHLPRLNVTAATRGCGKTLLLDVIGTMMPRSLRFENMTQAVLFRIIEKEKPSLLIDECDRHLRENNELIGLLNAGFTYGGLVPRCEGDKNEVRLYRVFAPVALSGIGDLPGTLHDRSIVIRMERATPNEINRRFDSRHVERETELKRKLMRWCADNKPALEAADPAMPSAFNRVADVWRPLFAIAAVAVTEWPHRVSIAFNKIQRPDADAEPIEVQCLQDVAAAMDGAGVESMPTHALVERLVLLDERPWQTYNQGKPISPRQLAKLLRGFKIRPTKLSGDEDTTAGTRGYKRETFNNALTRYPPPPPPSEEGGLSAIPPQPKGGAGFDDLVSATSDEPMADKKEQKPSNGAVYGGMAHKTPFPPLAPISDAEHEREAAEMAALGVDL